MYTVDGKDALIARSKARGLNNANMRCLVGEHPGNIKPGHVKDHEKHWIRLRDSTWLQRDGLDEPVLVVGGITRPEHFIAAVA